MDNVSYYTPICPYCKISFANWKDKEVDPRDEKDIFVCDNCGEKFAVKTKIIYSFESEKT